MIRTLKFGGAGIIVFILGLGLLFFSPVGLRLAWAITHGVLSPRLTIESVQGRLAGPLQIRGLKVSGDGVRVDIADAELNWHPLRLLLGELHLQSLRITGLRATIEERDKGAGAASEAEPTSYALPLGLRIDQLQISSMDIRSPIATEALHVHELDAALSVHGQDILLTQFTAHGEQWQLAVRGGRKETVWQLDQLDLVATESELHAHGRLDTEFALEWTLHTPDLGQLLPGAVGRLSSDGRVSGPRQRPSISARLQGSELAYRDYALERIHLDTDVDFDRARPSRITVVASELRLPRLRVASLGLQAHGEPGDHEASISLNSDRGRVAIALSGSWPLQATLWQGQLSEATVQPTNHPAWRLLDPATLQLDPARARLSNACWQSTTGRLCLQGDWQPDQSSARVELRELPLGVLNPLLAQRYKVDGRISGEGSWQQLSGQIPSFHLDATGKAVQLTARGSDGTPFVARATASHLRLHGEGGRWRSEAELALAPAGELRLLAALDDGFDPESALTGSVRADLPDLKFLAPLVPELDRIRGRLHGELQLGGILSAPRFTGEVRLADTQAAVPRIGQQLTELNARLAAAGDDVTLSAHSRMGGGELQLEAQGRLADGSMSAKLTGSELLAYDGADGKLWIEPDLSLAMRDQAAELKGQLSIPRANITPLSLSDEGIVLTSPDQVIVSEDRQENADRVITLISAIRIVLGEQVQFEGAGLKARITGSVMVADAPGQPTTATGELRLLDGTYRIYGQNLVIKQGRIVYTGGPLATPGLDFRAERYPTPDVTVGVRVRGTAQRPRVSLYSQPAMSDAERLSYLAFGVPLEGGASRNAALYRAALAIGLNEGEAAADKLGAQLGLDTLSIRSSESKNFGDAALVIGKYLTTRLYVSYGLGLFDAVRTLRVRYTLSKKWSVEAASGEYRGGDVLYSIER